MTTDRDERFREWLQERGIEGTRRIVRATPSGILVSKFGEGFAATLFDAVDRLDALFDDEHVSRETTAVAARNPSQTRVAAWHEATLRILREAVDAGAITAAERAEVEAGVDSVAALLDTALWSGPTFATSDWTPSDGETEAFRDALARMDDADGLFARYYGEFEGLRVENHCPGVRVARRLLEQAWVICTGCPVPAVN